MTAISMPEPVCDPPIMICSRSAGIVTTINHIKSATQVIADAVNQQGAATHDIASNTVQAASGTAEVTGQMQSVYTATQQTGAAAEQLRGLSDSLADQAATLETEIGQFVAQLKAS